MFDSESYKKILVLAPHTDDGELGAGGSIAKWIEQGKEVVYVAFSSCSNTPLEGFPKNILLTEVKAATKILGIEEKNLYTLEYEVRNFFKHRQEILDDMIKIKKSFDPQVVLIPSNNDLHQDHQIIYQEGIRAYKDRTVLSYEMPWNNLTFNNICFSCLEERHMKKKKEALCEYKSQSKRKYLNERFIESQMRFRGVQVGVEFAEVFEVQRLIF